MLSPEDLSDPEIKAGSPALQADSLPTEPPGKPISHCIVAAKDNSIFLTNRDCFTVRDFILFFYLLKIETF